MADEKEVARKKITGKLFGSDAEPKAESAALRDSDSERNPELELANKIYQSDPDFQLLLTHFQNAEWDACLAKIDQFLARYPEDAFLLAFRQDVEVRVAIQQESKQRGQQENRERQAKSLLKVFGILLWSVVIGALFLWSVQAFNNYRNNLQLEREAAILSQELEAKYNNADLLLRAGKAEDALVLYGEIQALFPGYRDIDNKISQAAELIDLEERYQQGVAAFDQGDSAEALQILKEVESRSANYKDAQQYIAKIERDNLLANLIQDVKLAYEREDWNGVVQAHDALKVVDPFLKVPELDGMLFISYRNLIIQIAGQADASLEEIELAEKYYRTALSLAPQSKDFVAEREELQGIAISLLANKYYLYGMSLLESSNYSVSGLRESLRLLNKAYGIGSGSPVIRSEIEKAQLFLDSYDSFLRRRWSNAIQGFEQLYRKDNNYAQGMLKYLLYEAYMARGDSFLAFSDFQAALVDYQEAEKYAWGSENNAVYLFKVETRIASALRKLWRMDDAAEFYRFAFDYIGYQKLLTTPEQQAMLADINAAKQAFLSGNALESVQFYELAMEKEDTLYQYITVKVSRGDSLAQVAFTYRTTVENLRRVNTLGESLTFGSDQEILVPVIPAGDN